MPRRDSREGNRNAYSDCLTGSAALPQISSLECGPLENALLTLLTSDAHGLGLLTCATQNASLHPLFWNLMQTGTVMWVIDVKGDGGKDLFAYFSEVKSGASSLLRMAKRLALRLSRDRRACKPQISSRSRRRLHAALVDARFIRALGAAAQSS